MVVAKTVRDSNEVEDKYRLALDLPDRAVLVKCKESSEYQTASVIAYIYTDDVKYNQSDNSRREILEEMLQSILGPGNFEVEVDKSAMWKFGIDD